MNGLSGYLLSIVGAVLVCAVLTVIAPEGKTSAVIKGMTRLVCVLVIVAPILRFFNTGELESLNDKNVNAFFSETVIRTKEEFIKYYSEMRIEATERALEEELSQKYSVLTEATLEWQTERRQTARFYEEESIRITSIKIRFIGTHSKEEEQTVWEYVSKNYCSEVLIE